MLLRDDSHSPIGRVIPVSEMVDRAICPLRAEDIEPHRGGAQNRRRTYLFIVLIEGKDEGVITRVPECVVCFGALRREFMR